jgi:hypothetical protein
MQSQARQTRFTAPAAGSTASSESRTDHYGGLVGDLLAQIETRIATPPIQRTVAVTMPPKHVDWAHAISVAAGYIGLAAGFAVAGFCVASIF